MIKKVSNLLLLSFLGIFLFCSIASAHVTVTPDESTTGAWETYTMKVPVEKDVATTKVTLKVPEGLEVKSYQPVPGWNFTSEKDANGKLATITYETTGEGILPGQFQQFTFVAKNSDTATKAVWDAFQYYKDGTVVEWTGDEGSEKPHAITNIVAGAAEGNNHDADSAKEETKNDKSNDTQSNGQSNSLPLILSSLAAILSLAAFVLAVRKK
ncbi:YcnI family protein [Jeotgalibacillus proteolyticus]|nr:DUF1775 domain-containing protein [Jeotgalibacillus proteolyticus]